MSIREGSKGSADPYSANFDRVFGVPVGQPEREQTDTARARNAECETIGNVQDQHPKSLLSNELSTS
jgi:hypothetical protein